MRLFISAALLACSLAAAPPQAVPIKDRIVIVISLDGFASKALRDPMTAAPALRRLIQEGATATNGMLPINPTVTWPNHTAMVTGVDATRHGVLYNGLPVRTPGKPVYVEASVPKSQLVLAPTVYDLAHEAGLKTAEVDWVAIEDTPSIDWAFSEIPKPDAPIVKEMVQAGRVSGEEINTFRRAIITWRDDIWTQAAIHILREHHPNLLLFHTLTTDSNQHRYGFGSLAGQTALALADRQVQRILDALKESGLEQRATVFVVSDHGFATAKRLIHPDAILHREGLIRSRDDCDVWAIPEGGTAMVYVTNEQRRSELIPRLRQMFQGVEGIREVISPEQYAKFGFPPPGHNSRMADFVLAADEGYAFSGALDGAAVTDVAPGAPSGNHGYLNTDPAMRAIFIAWGNGIRPGARLDEIRNVDVAPTIAHLLGLEMKNISGRPLTGILK
jgi:predicted AlkP superfamily pyrophosphatase or phosphodiesterase